MLFSHIVRAMNCCLVSGIWSISYISASTDAPSLAIQDRYISFITSTDPNHGIKHAPAGSKAYWPKWHEKTELMDLELDDTSLIVDDFRSASYEYIKAHINSFRY